MAAVLAEIAEAAAETLELQAVFERVATAVRRLIPLDNMGVVRILDGQWAVLHAITMSGHFRDAKSPARDHVAACPVLECSQPQPLSSWSPRLRPRPGPIARVDDAAVELDPTFPFDRRMVDKGVRSALWEPLRMAEGYGGVWLNAYRPHAFTAEHQEILRPIAALLGSVVEHWRIWDVERRRRERLDRLEVLFETLAESLDVREVFERLSREMQSLLPHDMLVLTELDLRARSIRLAALAGQCDIQPPTDPIPLTEHELGQRDDFEIVRDIPAEVVPDTERQRLLIATGMRSWLRVPVGLSGEVKGGLGFFHREPSRYDGEDEEVARRLADRIALMLSHQRLAEEARIASEARERAERLEATVETLTRELASRERTRVVGTSHSWKEVLKQVGRVASSETTVLITGESGTGKEIVANLIRQGSPRTAKPFVAVNCAALPEQLLESELFGHERGAFTGAVATKVGRLEQAAGGTLFLDEVAEMSPLVQAKLLRVLQEREFQRVGGTRVLRADVRVLAATNRELTQAMADGRFREDLYYRLNVFQIHVPPLRDRTEDILPLAESFLDELGPTLGRHVAGISRDAREWLLAYPWPGNVRELRNAIERAILLCDGGLITRVHLPTMLSRTEPSRLRLDEALDDGAPLPADGVDLEQVERSLVARALRETKGNKARAARMLRLTRSQLYSRIEKYGLSSSP